MTKIIGSREDIRFPIDSCIQLGDVGFGDTLKIVYSLDGCKKGLFYDIIVHYVASVGSRRQIVGDIIYGRERRVRKDCVVSSLSKIYRISCGAGTLYLYRRFLSILVLK